MTHNCLEHNALRNRLDRHGIAALSAEERNVLGHCPACGPAIVAVQDALGDLVGLGTLEPDLDETVDAELLAPVIPVDTSRPNAWMSADAPPPPARRRRPEMSSVISAAIVMLLAVIAAIII